jgi:hypothetical protein
MHNYEQYVDKQLSERAQSPPLLRDRSNCSRNCKDKNRFRVRQLSQGQDVYRSFTKTEAPKSEKNQVNYFSDGLMSRADLKFRLRTHKKR